MPRKTIRTSYTMTCHIIKVVKSARTVASLCSRTVRSTRIARGLIRLLEIKLTIAKHRERRYRNEFVGAVQVEFDTDKNSCDHHGNDNCACYTDDHMFPGDT